MKLSLKKTRGNYIPEERDFKTNLKNITGLKPGNLHIYEVAFIHHSASVTLPNGRVINNERLEYLGDAILSAVLTDYLFSRFPDSGEGSLTRKRSRLVNRKTLNRAAKSMGIDKLLMAEIPQKADSKHLYGDALEALIGAIFLDKGYKKTKSFLINNLMKNHLDIEKAITVNDDYKSMLLEWGQKNNSSISFSYRTEYDSLYKRQNYISMLTVDNRMISTGTAVSKKEAEQIAAQRALLAIKKQ